MTSGNEERDQIALRKEILRRRDIKNYKYPYHEFKYDVDIEVAVLNYRTGERFRFYIKEMTYDATHGCKITLKPVAGSTIGLGSGTGRAAIVINESAIREDSEGLYINYNGSPYKLKKATSYTTNKKRKDYT